MTPESRLLPKSPQRKRLLSSLVFALQALLCLKRLEILPLELALFARTVSTRRGRDGAIWIALLRSSIIIYYLPCSSSISLSIRVRIRCSHILPCPVSIAPTTCHKLSLRFTRPPMMMMFDVSQPPAVESRCRVSLLLLSSVFSPCLVFR